MAPFRPEASNPASSSWAAPASRRDHDEADERTERARLALVRARWEAQGGGGPTRRQSTSTRQRGQVHRMLSHRYCCCWRDEHLQFSGGEGHLDVCDDGSTCRAAPRPKWDSGGSLQRPRLVEQPAPRERTQIPVATQFL